MNLKRDTDKIKETKIFTVDPPKGMRLVNLQWDKNTGRVVIVYGRKSNK